MLTLRSLLASLWVGALLVSSPCVPSATTTVTVTVVASPHSLSSSLDADSSSSWMHHRHDHDHAHEQGRRNDDDDNEYEYDYEYEPVATTHRHRHARRAVRLRDYGSVHHREAAYDDERDELDRTSAGDDRVLAASLSSNSAGNVFGTAGGQKTDTNNPLLLGSFHGPADVAYHAWLHRGVQARYNDAKAALDFLNSLGPNDPRSPPATDAEKEALRRDMRDCIARGAVDGGAAAPVVETPHARYRAIPFRLSSLVRMASLSPSPSSASSSSCGGRTLTKCSLARRNPTVMQASYILEMAYKMTRYEWYMKLFGAGIPWMQADPDRTDDCDVELTDGDRVEAKLMVHLRNYLISNYHTLPQRWWETSAQPHYQHIFRPTNDNHDPVPVPTTPHQPQPQQGENTQFTSILTPTSTTPPTTRTTKKRNHRRK